MPVRKVNRYSGTEQTRCETVHTVLISIDLISVILICTVIFVVSFRLPKRVETIPIPFTLQYS